MSKPVGAAAFQLTYQLSPIIFTGGIAQLIPGFGLPIIAITESINYLASGILGQGSDLSLDRFFANYSVEPGGSLIALQVGTYPFANQAVAANAIITDPNRVSLRMTCPVQAGRGGWAAKIAIMSALQTALQQHVLNGGTFTVMTPAKVYTNCLLTGFTDIGGNQPSQPQREFRFDFFQPLLTEEQANVVLNSPMSAIANMVPTTGATSGLSTGLGSALSGMMPSLIPSSSGAGGAGVAGPLPALPL